MGPRQGSCSSYPLERQIVQPNVPPARPMMENIKLPKFSSVVKVGDGRGFVFDQKARPPGWDRPELKKLGLRPFALRRCIITAAHCLPHFPEPHAWESFDRVYPDLLGALGGKPSVWALLLFADPVADIAVLGSPDTQEMFVASPRFSACSVDAKWLTGTRGLASVESRGFQRRTEANAAQPGSCGWRPKVMGLNCHLSRIASHYYLTGTMLVRRYLHAGVPHSMLGPPVKLAITKGTSSSSVW